MRLGLAATTQHKGHRIPSSNLTPPHWSSRQLPRYTVKVHSGHMQPTADLFQWSSGTITMRSYVLDVGVCSPRLHLESVMVPHQSTKPTMGRSGKDSWRRWSITLRFDPKNGEEVTTETSTCVYNTGRNTLISTDSTLSAAMLSSAICALEVPANPFPRRACYRVARSGYPLAVMRMVGTVSKSLSSARR